MTVPSLFLHEHEARDSGIIGDDGPSLLVPQIRPGLEFVLRGFGCIRHTPINVGVEVWDDIPVRAFEMIAGEPGRVKEITSLNFGTAMMDPFLYLHGVFQVHHELFGIEWRLGDEPVARVLREEMGL